MELADTGKVIGNIYCGDREYQAKSSTSSTGAGATPPRPSPPSSRRLLEKTGLRLEAHLRSNVFFRRDGKGAPVWQDTLIYALTADEFPLR